MSGSEARRKALSLWAGRLIEAQEENEPDRPRVARRHQPELALLANGVQEFEQAISSDLDSFGEAATTEIWQLTNEVRLISNQVSPVTSLQTALPRTGGGRRDSLPRVFPPAQNEFECVIRDLPQDSRKHALSCFRIVQESLRMSSKHSQAHT